MSRRRRRAPRPKRGATCRVLGCARERLYLLDVCAYHTPEKLALYERNKARLAAINQARRKDGFVERSKPRRKLVTHGLSCVYKPFVLEKQRGSGDTRVVYVGGICGAPAPKRLTGDRSQPRFPNRFGEPLCAEHARYAFDPHAFPPDPSFPDVGVEGELGEDNERRRRELGRLERMLARAVEDVRRTRS